MVVARAGDRPEVRARAGESPLAVASDILAVHEHPVEAPTDEDVIIELWRAALLNGINALLTPSGFLLHNLPLLSSGLRKRMLSGRPSGDPA